MMYDANVTTYFHLEDSIMKKLILVAIFTILASAATYAQKPKYIGMKAAKAIALKQVTGTIKSAERETENDKVIYSFDIMTDKGVLTEVEIDAVTGEVLSNKVETPEDEATEKAEDKNGKEKDDKD